MERLKLIGEYYKRERHYNFEKNDLEISSANDMEIIEIIDIKAGDKYCECILNGKLIQANKNDIRNIHYAIENVIEQL